MPAGTFYCESCNRPFKKRSAVKAHQRQSASCRWLLRERATQSSHLFDHHGSESEEDPPIQELGEHDLYAPFRESDSEHSEPQSPPAPGPSGPRHVHKARVEDSDDEDDAPPRFQNPHLDEDLTHTERATRARVEEELEEDVEPVIEAYEGAAEILGWSKTVHEQYLALQDEGDNPYRPFASRIAWEIAKIAKETDTGDNNLKRLLTVPGVMNFFTYSFYSSN